MTDKNIDLIDYFSTHGLLLHLIHHKRFNFSLNIDNIIKECKLLITNLFVNIQNNKLNDVNKTLLTCLSKSIEYSKHNEWIIEELNKYKYYERCTDKKHTRCQYEKLCEEYNKFIKQYIKNKFGITLDINC